MNAEIKNNKELQKYTEELRNDVELNVHNLREKSLMSSAMWAKWLQYLFHEKENLDRIIETKQKILKKKMAESNMSDSVLRVKNEDKIAANDQNIQKLNTLQKITKDNIDFIERALNILSNFGFSIKNTTEILKLTSN